MRRELYEARRADRQQEIDAAVAVGNVRDDGRAMSTDPAEGDAAEPPALDPLPSWEDAGGPASCEHLGDLKARFRTLSPGVYAELLAHHQGALEEHAADMERLRDEKGDAAAAIGISRGLTAILGSNVRQMVVTVEGFVDESGSWGVGTVDEGLSDDDIATLERAGLLLILNDLGMAFQRLGKERGTFGLSQPPT